MILIDYHQITIANYSILRISKESEEIDSEMIMDMLVSSICKCKRDWSGEYGNIVLCDDAKDTWRHEAFQYYKQKRKDAKKESSTDWDAMLPIMNKAKSLAARELKIPTIKINRAEADDVIGIVSRECSKRKEKVLIYSRDKDFKQVHDEYVSQYSSIAKDWITVDNAKEFLEEMLLVGDSGDGIPNVLSSDDCLVCEGKRQTPLTKKKKEMFVDSIPKEYLANYERNKKLISFDSIPLDIVSDIKVKLNRVDEYFESIGDE